MSEDEWPIQMGSASHPDMLTYSADRLEQEMKDSSRDGELVVPPKPHGFKNKMCLSVNAGIFTRLAFSLHLPADLLPLC